MALEQTPKNYYFGIHFIPICTRRRVDLLHWYNHCTTMAARFSAAFIICKHPWQQLLRFQEFYLFLCYDLKWIHFLRSSRVSCHIFGNWSIHHTDPLTLFFFCFCFFGWIETFSTFIPSSHFVTSDIALEKMSMFSFRTRYVIKNR